MPIPLLDDVVANAVNVFKGLCNGIDMVVDAVYSALHDAWFNGSNYIEICVEGVEEGFEYLCIIYHILFYRYPVDLEIMDYYPVLVIHRDKELDLDMEVIFRNSLVIQSIGGVIRFYVGKHVLKYLRKYRWDCSRVSYKVYSENPMGEFDE